MQWVPAAWSNYRSARRSAGDIDWIILHTIEGSYQAGINTFENPVSDVSAHFVVGTEPGEITKMVPLDDIAWTAGNSDYNARGINIELAGYSSNGFPAQQYDLLADLVDYLCETYSVPKRHPTDRVAPCDAAAGRGGIIGHVQIPSPYNCSARGGAGGHTDPGPYFDYDRLLSEIDGGEGSTPGFEVGRTVATTTALNVRSSAEFANNLVDTRAAGDSGDIRNGPYTNDGYRWWWVNWGDGVAGWSVEQYLEVDEDASGGDEGGSDDGGGDRDDGSDGDGGDDSDGSNPAFKIGEEVATTTALNTRSGPGIDSGVRETVSEQATGYVKDGYVTSDDYTWWKVAWETGTTGWSVEQYIEDTGPEEDDSGGSDDDTGADDGGGGNRDDDAGDDGSSSEAAFKIGEEVATTTALNTRGGPGLDNAVRETVFERATGYVKDGYVTSGGYTWWKVAWETGTTGWSVEQHIESVSTDSRGSVPPREIATTTSLRRRIDVSGRELDAAIRDVRPNSPLIGLGDTWVATQEELEIDAIYQAAHAIWESAWGTSEIAQAKRNIYGFDARDVCPYECADGFRSFEACIDQTMAYVDENYLSPDGRYYNGATLQGMNVKYATDPNWASGIASVYNTLVEQL
jgi:N-acetyl-anhydromuramyl-L-alanine amidase AmpD